MHEATRAVVDASRAERPDITVAIRHYPIATTHAGHDAGEVDVAALRLPMVLTGLHTLTLYTEPRAALLPRDHPLGCRIRIHLASCRAAVDNDRGAGSCLAGTRATGAERDRPDASVVAATLDEFLEAVIAGRGVGALAPASASRLYARPGVAFIEVATPSHPSERSPLATKS